jgi:hypothetical protein
MNSVRYMRESQERHQITVIVGLDVVGRRVGRGVGLDVVGRRVGRGVGLDVVGRRVG